MVEEDLLHYGTPRHSGRYPWGSGEDPQRNADFLTEYDHLKNGKGMKETEIAKSLGMTTTQLRSKRTMAKADREVAIAQAVKTGLDRGDKVTDIAKRTGISESSVRNYAKKDPSTITSKKQIDNISDSLRTAVDKTGYLDIGAGVERQLGISKVKLKAVVDKMKEEGYYEHKIYVPQVTNPANKTTLKILTKNPDYKEVFKNQDKVRPVDFYTDDGGLSMTYIKKPKSVDWDRVHIRYAEEGGLEKDGTMELRPSAKDLEMGNSHYAQVRIGVGGTHYLKGMALYGDEKDFPNGADIIFNTNKAKGTPPQKVLKEMKDDPTNPFGASIKRQNNTNTVNIVNEEGDWSGWSKTLSAQMLSKQPKPVVKERLEATLKHIDDDYAEIMKVTNPVVRKQLLESYSSDLESKQVHLKAIAPARTNGHVILPIPNMKETEVYAPRYKDGENVILIRYPHGGTFEIPELTVNNKGPGKNIVGPNSPDAIGIHPKVAAKLSGADFDGDTVYLIPNNQKKFVSRSSLTGLKDFDPNQYADDPTTFKKITPDYKQKQMGIVSNLITDMTLHGATDDELARAVRHSMVVIDSEKHVLNYKRSERDNGIAALQKKYQTHIEKVDYANLGSVSSNDLSRQAKGEQGLSSQGASTIISRHKQTTEIATPKTRAEEIPKYNSKGEVVGTKIKYKNTKTSYVTNLIDDAKVLSSGTPIEGEYVKYINGLKARNNKVLKEMAAIKFNKRDPKAAAVYQEEVKSLEAKLNKSLLNAPRERQAQILARYNYNERIKLVDGGEKALEKDRIKKLKQQSLVAARVATHAERSPVVITDNEWDAIQANAVSSTTLKDLIKNMDDAQLKQLATPREKQVISDKRKSKAILMLNNGYTLSDVAHALGVSVSTVSSIRSESGNTTEDSKIAASTNLDDAYIGVDYADTDQSDYGWKGE